MKEKSLKTQVEGKQSLKRAIQNNLFIIKYIYKYTPMFLIGTILVAAISEVVVFFEHTYCIKYMTDIIQYNGSFSSIVRYISIISVVVALKILMTSYYNKYVQLKAKEKLHKYIRMDLFNKAVSLDFSCYDNPEHYNDFVWSISEAANRIDKTIEYLFQVVTCIATVFTVGTLFMILSKAGLIFIMFSVITTTAINLALNKLRFKMDTELIPKQRNRSYLNRVFYLADYAKEIRLNNIADKLKRSYNQANDDIYSTIDRRSPRMVLLAFLSDYVFNSFILDSLFTVYLLFQAVVKNTMSYGSVIALLNSSWRLKSSLMKLSALVSQFQQNSLYIERIRIFLDYEQLIKNIEDAKEVPHKPCLLELKDVSFAYTEKGKPILKNISIKIKPNEKIAFVGYNGAGKTTLTKLLMRLYDVSEGEILLNNVNIKDYKIESYRNNIRAVFQDYQIFASSIAENVIMDEIKEDHGEPIINALKKSGFMEKLNLLKSGVNTQLTREFEDSGVNISGGEAQKIAISRVFASPCNIIILDEPSSALDPISECNINEAMLEAAKDKTVIFISHRLSSTRMADRIYMLENGSVIEEGSHDDLIAQGGKYAQMFNLQAEKYRFNAG